MGTIKSGFWSLSFILSSNEFIDFIKYSKSLNLKFERENVFREYELFYNTLISKTCPKILHQQENISFITLESFVCMLNINVGMGVSITPANEMCLNYREDTG